MTSFLLLLSQNNVKKVLKSIKNVLLNVCERLIFSTIDVENLC